MWLGIGNLIPITKNNTGGIVPPPPFTDGIIAENSPYTGAGVIFIETQGGDLLEQE